MTTDSNMLTVAEVAARLRLHEESVRRWLREGRIRGVRIGRGRAGYRIPASEVTRILSVGMDDRANDLDDTDGPTN